MTDANPLDSYKHLAPCACGMRHVPTCVLYPTPDSAPAPFYADHNARLWQGDCLEVLPALTLDPDPFALAIFDPPYNVGKGYPGGDSLTEDEYEDWLLEVLSLLRLQSLTLAWTPGVVNVELALRLLRESGWHLHRMLGWHKKEYAGDKFGAGPAMCWEPILWATRDGEVRWNRQYGAAGRDFLVVPSTHGNPVSAWHPCPKPIAVYHWLIGLFCPEGAWVLDPTAGSGTSLVAAREMGRRAMGIELDPGYCEEIRARLAPQVLDYTEVPA